MFAKIYRPAKNAMQSGRGKLNTWLLEFTPSMARRPDPLMGWTSTKDTKTQVRLKFDNKDEAIAYAKRQGIPFQVSEPTAGLQAGLTDEGIAGARTGAGNPGKAAPSPPIPGGPCVSPSWCAPE